MAPNGLKYWVGVQWGQSYLIGRRCLFRFGWTSFYWYHKNTLWGRCFTTSTSLAPHLFLLGWLKLNLTLLLEQFRLAREMNADGSCDKCWCISVFGFFRLDLSPWGYRNRCFLVALCHMIVRRLNLEVATKRLLHQQVKYWGSFSAIFMHGGASLQLFSVM